MFPTTTRRGFLGMLAAASARAARTRPDVILHGATIHTVDARQPRAQAVAIAGDRLLAVGSDDEVLNLAAAGTKKIDLRGKTVVPGFIDAHTHPVSSGIRHLRWIDADLRSNWAQVWYTVFLGWGGSWWGDGVGVTWRPPDWRFRLGFPAGSDAGR